MQIYHSRYTRLHGSSYKEIYPQVLEAYKEIQRNTKRQPYVRSSYFAKDKVFLTYFWQHIREKNYRDRMRRLRCFAAAIDLLRNSTYPPTIKKSPNSERELLYRFMGSTKDKQIFYVQVKEDTKTKRKDLISIFPAN